MTDKLTINQLRDLAHEGEIQDPLVYLESIQSGFDPRKLSDLYNLVLEIDEFSDGGSIGIGSGDWMQLVELVSSQYKYHPVSLSESTAAAKTLAEYMHAKRKQVDINNGGDAGVIDLTLTRADIEQVNDIFELDF